jgi:hypothetical protein
VDVSRGPLDITVAKARLRRDYALSAAHPALGRLDERRLRRDQRRLELADSPEEIAKLQSRLDGLRARLNDPQARAGKSRRLAVPRVVKVTVIFLIVSCCDYLLTEGEVPEIWNRIYLLARHLSTIGT